MNDASKRHAALLERWLRTYREDVGVYLALLRAEGETVSERGRETAAGVLNYQLKKFDLAPDWRAAVGFVDDALVLRAGAMVFHANNLTELPDELESKLGAMRDEDRLVREVCGELYERFYERVRALREERILGRLPDEIAKDRAKSAEMIKAVEAYLETYHCPLVEDAEQLVRDVRGYLTHRLPPQ